MQYTPKQILRIGPVIPVIVIRKVDNAVPLAKALLAGGVKVIEVTLRSDVALDAIQAIKEQVPETVVGAGTVLSTNDLRDVEHAGAAFAISPGLTPSLLQAAKEANIPLIPGISSASELMYGMEAGLKEFKFFPAQAAGGIEMLRSLAGPFPQVSFCPTGGITPANYKKYLALENVACVGGSWLAPNDAVTSCNWSKITNICHDAVA